MSRRTPTLQDRADLYAGKHSPVPWRDGMKAITVQELRAKFAKAWLDGHQAAMRRRAKRRKS